MTPRYELKPGTRVYGCIKPVYQDKSSVSVQAPVADPAGKGGL